MSIQPEFFSTMATIKTCSKYFSITDTLLCGQIFRFTPFKDGYKVFAGDKCCYAYNLGDFAYIECEEGDEEFFKNFFDLYTDYSEINSSAQDSGYDILVKAAKEGRGIRILNQNPLETLFSFIVSQNNNIPRIKKIIEALCHQLGEEKTFLGETYYSFPSPYKMANMPLEFYKNIGLGYRAEYILRLAKEIANNGFDEEYLKSLSTPNLKKELIKIHGVGEKVADCVLLFGFKRTDSFPVDTWIDKVYRTNFNGKEKDRSKITAFFLELFKDKSGYFQQYLFYYKRSKEEK